MKQSTHSSIVIGIRSICLGAIISLAITTIAALTPDLSPWFATPIILLGTILVPGTLLAFVFRLRSVARIDFVLYAVSLGLAFLLLGGLAINTFLPYLGIMQPLAAVPLIVSIDVLAAMIGIAAYVRNRGYSVHLELPTPTLANVLFSIVPFIFLCLSVAGAERLNNGGSGVLTLIMLFGIAVYVVVLVLMQRSLGSWTYGISLYVIGLSLLLMYSLRSNHIFGWDINQEYEVFQMTYRQLVWKMSYYPGLDYNACMSITILPTMFAVLTRVTGEYIFKFTFQLLFAVTPVVVYALARRYVSLAYAFLAGFLFISQTWFFEQMPALIRQEIAFVFCAVLILLFFERRISSTTKYLLLMIFTIALILSHYSTAYVWIALLGGMLAIDYVLQYLLSTTRKITFPPKHTYILLIVSFALLCVWQISLTQTATKIVRFITNDNYSTLATSTQGIAKAKTEIRRITLAAASTTATNTPQTAGDETVLAAQKYAIITYVASVGYVTFAGSSHTGYVPMQVSAVAHAPSLFPGIVSRGLMLMERIARYAAIGLLPLVGIAVLLFGTHPLANDRRTMAALGIGSIGLLAATLLVPYLQEYYNFSRLYLQVLIVLSVIAMIGAAALLSYVPRGRLLLCGVLFAVIFCASSGALDQFTGGPLRLTFDQPPGTLDVPYIYDAEVASARWLEANRTPGSLIQSDNGGIIRLQSFGGFDAGNTALFPQTINRDSYIYLTTNNITTGNAYYEYENNLLTYNLPIQFIDSHKALIYSNGGSEIYR